MENDGKTKRSPQGLTDMMNGRPVDAAADGPVYEPQQNHNTVRCVYCKTESVGQECQACGRHKYPDV